MNEFYNSNEEMNDFTEHFIQCYTLNNDEKSPDQIKEEDFQKLNSILQKMIDNKKKEEASRFLPQSFSNVLNSIKQALTLTK